MKKKKPVFLDLIDWHAVAYDAKQAALKAQMRYRERKDPIWGEIRRTARLLQRRAHIALEHAQKTFLDMEQRTKQLERWQRADKKARETMKQLDSLLQKVSGKDRLPHERAPLPWGNDYIPYKLKEDKSRDA